MIFLSVPFVILAWMWGGQTEKWVRPVGVALSIYLIYLAFNLHTWYLGLPALMYGGELTFGYGEKSLFHKLAKGNDELIRIYYSIWCCIPVLVSCAIQGHWLRMLSCALIIGAFQIRAGSLGKIGKYDILIEDIARSLAVGTSMCISLV
jgi:hypothetical protein